MSSPLWIAFLGGENMAEDVRYKQEDISINEVVLFRSRPIIECEDSFKSSHYFNDFDKLTINTDFKNALEILFEVDSIEALKKAIKPDTELEFKSGHSHMLYDKDSNKVIVFMESYKDEVLEPAKKLARVRNGIKDLHNAQRTTEGRVAEILTLINDNIDTASLTKKEKREIAKIIPELIKNGDFKISITDITSMNKVRLTEVVKIGRGILNRDYKYYKLIGLERKHLGLEFAWQKYFEIYGTYLLFGSIEEPKGEYPLLTKELDRKTDSSIDYLYMNKYGFIDIVELKKAEEFMFKWDKSHDNFIPTSSLSSAISQLNQYLMLLPYDKNKGIRLVDGAESASGLLIIGKKDYLMKKKSIDDYMIKYNLSEIEVFKKLRLALRHLNYSLANVEVILYDELLDNLDNFISQMEVELYD